VSVFVVSCDRTSRHGIPCSSSVLKCCNGYQLSSWHCMFLMQRAQFKSIRINLLALKTTQFCFKIIHSPNPVTGRSKAKICGPSLHGIAGSNLAGRHGCLSAVNDVCCQVEVSGKGRSLVHRSPNDRVCACVCVCH